MLHAKQENSVTAAVQEVMNKAYAEGVFTNGGFVLCSPAEMSSVTWSTTRDTASGLDWVFDTASLTKVLGTWPLLVEALARNELTLLTRMSDIFSGCTNWPGARLTVADLATHSAGLRQETRLDKYTDEQLGHIESVILGEDLERVPGQTVQYGNRAFILLGRVLEQVSGQLLPTLLEHRITGPFGLTRTRYGSTGADVVSTLRAYSGEWVTGESHDRNAELLGGAAGHAGLFTTLNDMSRYGRALLEQVHNASPWTQLSLTPWFPEGEKGFRGLAWCLRPGTHGYFAYHHGFTGGTVILHPQARQFLAMLTDSVNCGERHPGLATVRASLLAIFSQLH